jgi:hypothetical protein
MRRAARPTWVRPEVAAATGLSLVEFDIRVKSLARVFARSYVIRVRWFVH